MSSEDAQAEGIYYEFVEGNSTIRILKRWVAPGVKMRSIAGDIDYHAATHNSPLDAFQCLWDSINAKRGYEWYSNPWVWVVEFELINGKGS